MYEHWKIPVAFHHSLKYNGQPSCDNIYFQFSTQKYVKLMILNIHIRSFRGQSLKMTALPLYLFHNITKRWTAMWKRATTWDTIL